MLIFIAATVLILTTGAASDQSYKSATEVLKAMTQISDAEIYDIHEIKKAFIKKVPAAYTEYSHLRKTNKTLYDKMKAFDDKFLKLDSPGKKFITNVMVSVGNELRKQGSQIKNVQKGFDELRKDKKACEKLLGLYPGLKLGKC